MKISATKKQTKQKQLCFHLSDGNIYSGKKKAVIENRGNVKKNKQSKIKLNRTLSRQTVLQSNSFIVSSVLSYPTKSRLCYTMQVDHLMTLREQAGIDESETVLLRRQYFSDGNVDSSSSTCSSFKRVTRFSMELTPSRWTKPASLPASSARPSSETTSKPSTNPDF